MSLRTRSNFELFMRPRPTTLDGFGDQEKKSIFLLWELNFFAKKILFATCTCPIMHLICRPKFCITLFWISLGTAVIPRRKEQQRLCQQVQEANWIDHQHGRLVTWWQTKNSSIIDLGLRSLSHSVVWMMCSHSINPYTINPSTVFFLLLTQPVGENPSTTLERAR